jgi:hypothetical protein
VVEELLHLMVDRKQRETERSPGQDIASKDTCPVTYFLQLGPAS